MRAAFVFRPGSAVALELAGRYLDGAFSVRLLGAGDSLYAFAPCAFHRARHFILAPAYGAFEAMRPERISDGEGHTGFTHAGR